MLLLGGEPLLHLYISCAAYSQIYTEVRVAGPRQLHSRLQARKIQTNPVRVRTVWQNQVSNVMQFHQISEVVVT